MNDATSARDKVGLCSDCRFTKAIVSGKGSQFFLCLRAEIDSHFSKYPRLPMHQCSGYERQRALSESEEKR